MEELAMDLAISAAMAVFGRHADIDEGDRHNGRGTSDLRNQLEYVIYAAMELGSDAGPDAWNEAKRTLERLLREDIHGE